MMLQVVASVRVSISPDVGVTKAQRQRRLGVVVVFCGCVIGEINYWFCRRRTVSSSDVFIAWSGAVGRGRGTASEMCWSSPRQPRRLQRRRSDGRRERNRDDERSQWISWPRTREGGCVTGSRASRADVRRTVCPGSIRRWRRRRRRAIDSRRKGQRAVSRQQTGGAAPASIGDVHVADVDRWTVDGRDDDDDGTRRMLSCPWPFTAVCRSFCAVVAFTVSDK